MLQIKASFPKDTTNVKTSDLFVLEPAEPVEVSVGGGFQRKHARLKSLPIPMSKIAQKFITSIIDDFIKTWYTQIGPTEKDFIDEVEVR